MKAASVRKRLESLRQEEATLTEEIAQLGEELSELRWTIGADGPNSSKARERVAGVNERLGLANAALEATRAQQTVGRVKLAAAEADEAASAKAEAQERVAVKHDVINGLLADLIRGPLAQAAAEWDRIELLFAEMLADASEFELGSLKLTGHGYRVLAACEILFNRGPLPNGSRRLGIDFSRSITVTPPLKRWVLGALGQKAPAEEVSPNGTGTFA